MIKASGKSPGREALRTIFVEEENGGVRIAIAPDVNPAGGWAIVLPADEWRAFLRECARAHPKRRKCTSAEKAIVFGAAMGELHLDEVNALLRELGENAYVIPKSSYDQVLKVFVPIYRRHPQMLREHVHKSKTRGDLRRELQLKEAEVDGVPDEFVAQDTVNSG